MPSAGISLNYHDTYEDRIGTSPFHYEINKRISGKFDFDCDITTSEATATRKIYSAFTTLLWSNHICDISGFEGLEILKVCMEYQQIG